MSPADRMRHQLLGMRVDAGADVSGLVETIVQWARGRRSAYVCPLTVKALLRGSRDMPFRRIVNSADAAPCVDRQLAWWLEGGRLGKYPVDPGKAFLKHLVMRAQALEMPVGLYGAANGLRCELSAFLREHFPRLSIVALAPEVSAEFAQGQDMAATRAVNTYGVRLLLVCLGSPMEEQWMLNHKGRVHAVMVGASGLMIAGTDGRRFDSHPGRTPATLAATAHHTARPSRASVWLPRWESLRLGWRILHEAWQKAQNEVERGPLTGAARLRR